MLNDLLGQITRDLVQRPDESLDLLDRRPLAEQS
jgi:hypothetical protein